MRNISEARSGEMANSQDVIRKEPTPEEIKAMSPEELGKLLVSYLPDLRAFFISKNNKNNLNFDSEDLAQITYLKVLKNINSFRGDSSFKAWLIAIAKNLFLDKLKLKKDSSRNQVSIDNPPSSEGKSFDMPDFNSTSFATVLEDKDVLKKVIKILSSKQVLVMRLHYVDGLTISEIAKRQNMRDSAVKDLIYLAKKKVQQRLKTV